jgi:hypothetical protein
MQFGGLQSKGLNLDEIKSEGLHEKDSVVTWEPSQHLLEERERVTRKM